jgi:hypothetical protein
MYAIYSSRHNKCGSRRQLISGDKMVIHLPVYSVASRIVFTTIKGQNPPNIRTLALLINQTLLGSWLNYFLISFIIRHKMQGLQQISEDGEQVIFGSIFFI